MNKKVLVLASAMLFCLAREADFGWTKDDGAKKDNLYEQVELFASAVSIIRSDYVKEVDSRDLIYGALKGMLMSLDSHSQFLDPEAYGEMKVETEGKFGGLGIELTIKDGVLTIISPIEDTPAFKAGLRPNDRIVRIDGKSTRDTTLNEAVKKLRGEPGMPVNLTILREDEKKVLDFTIERGIIEIKSIKEARVLEDSIGYVKLVEFQENTPKDLAKGLASLKTKGIDSMILDLRNNPGGLLDASVKVSEMFLPQGKVVVSTKGRVSGQDITYKSNYPKPYLNFVMIILVNEGSASASEIVAGALRDNRRAIIVGSKTFGKGSVQTVIPLRDGSAVRVTTAEYFTPNGEAINNKGIIPDVEAARVRESGPAGDKKVEKDNEAEKETEDIFERPELKDQVKEKQPKADIHDSQLQRAVDLIKGIKAYEEVRKTG
ncbi:MAG: S41 family peptidase [Candidatus Omnitrophica bacterium]|nr:S41 family peptidase [Candidatus Omnitrophota bacterium]